VNQLIQVDEAASGGGNRGRNSRGRRPVKRRRPHPFGVLFEAVACSHQGSPMNGVSYRNGSKLDGLARCYQFREPGPGAAADGDETMHDLPLGALVRQRLQELLRPADLDLLYLRFCAGWSQADVARELGCNRSTVKRREERLCRRLRADPTLQRAALD
jgi:hypothetical protein